MYIYIYCGLNIFEYIWWILWTFAVQFGCRIPLIFTRLPHTASSRVGIKTTAFVPTGPARLLETNSHDIKIYHITRTDMNKWEKWERLKKMALNCSHLETQTRLTNQTNRLVSNLQTDSLTLSQRVWESESENLNKSQQFWLSIDNHSFRPSCLCLKGNVNKVCHTKTHQFRSTLLPEYQLISCDNCSVMLCSYTIHLN